MTRIVFWLFLASSLGAQSTVPWSSYGHDPQHTGLSTIGAQRLERIKWSTPVDLLLQGASGDLYIHYGSPLVTAGNTVLVPVRTTAANNYRVEAHSGADGSLLYTLATDFTPPPHNWIPSYSPALSQGTRLYYAGAGGTVYYRDQVDSLSGPTGQIAFYGNALYAANLAAFASSVMISTPITADANGNIYFGFDVVGSNPANLTSGLARVGADGSGSWISAPSAAQGDTSIVEVAMNCAPAVSNDGNTLYFGVSGGPVGGSSSGGYLVAVNSTTLAPIARVRLKDPETGLDAILLDDSSASPTVGPDGDVYYGVFESSCCTNDDRGWLLHFSSGLSQTKTPGAFGWDTTASVVPARLVPSYQGPSSYLLFTKYNNYLGIGPGGNGHNKIAVLDPSTAMTDPITGAAVMQEVITILGPTLDPPGNTNGTVREWCINSGAIDPFAASAIANSEDGVVYRWDFATNSFIQQVRLTAGVGEAYTPTAIGADGTAYAINDANLFAVAQAANLTISLTHSGSFTEGQSGATYTLIATNSGSGATNGIVTVADVLPASLTATSISGQGWGCTQPAGPCTRSDSMLAGASYPALTLTVNVAANAPSTVTNTATVSSDGAVNSVNSTAANLTNIAAAVPPVLSVTKTHGGNFTQGQLGATYTVTVSNAAGAGPTSGMVTVTETVPAGLALVSMAGTGWACSGNACTHNDPLTAGNSYSPITVTVNVAGNATSPQINAVSVTGGGSAPANTTDSTVIVPLLTAVTIQTSPTGLQFTVDGGVAQTAPQTVSLTQGTHTLAVAATQPGATGTQHVFTGWSDGGAASHSITVGSSTGTYTASFKTQFELTILASPAAGGTVTPASGAFYDAGSTVPVTATPKTGYTFTGWSGSVASAGSTSTSVTMSSAESITANFSSLTGITIQTNPPGLQFSVDGGAAQTAPQTLNLSQGTHAVAVATTQPGPGAPAGTQYVFTSWSDGGGASHNITVGASAATYTASFKTQYQLTLSASPAAGGLVTPASGSFYDSGTVVPISATSNAGYSFGAWTGPVANANNAATTVTMSGAENIIANFLPLTAVTIQTSPTGLQFSVDGGVLQTAPATLVLAQGSHTIAAATTQAGPVGTPAGTQYVFTGWSDGGAASHGITVGASAATYAASFKTQYQLTISASPAAGGTVTPASGSFYDVGTAVLIGATANAGYAFNGWSGGVASGGSASTTVTMSAPENIVANFSSLTGVTMQTNPPGLQFSVDGGALQTAPQVLNLSQGTHNIAVATTQTGAPGTQYVFTSWSDGGAASHNITVGSSAATYTATFVTQYLLTVTVSPPGLGSVTATPSSGNGYYASGTSVQLQASATAGYQFANWTGDLTSSANPLTVIMSAPRSVTATFATVTSVTIASNPSGLLVSVDGSTITTPQTFQWQAQSMHTLVAVSPQGANGTRDEFLSWSDGGPQAHSIAAPASPGTYTATFAVQYLLITSASPAAGGTVTVSPASVDGYYNAGSTIQLTATANAGYLFSNWTGDLSGAANPQSITMNALHSATANFTTPCSIGLTPASTSVPATGTSTPAACPNSSQPNCGVLPEVPVNFTVTPSAACGGWTATSSNPEFLQITSGASGSGVGHPGFTVLTNTHAAARNATITVASGGVSASFTVTQAGSGDSQTYREVYALYEQLLGRDPDQPGLAFWTGQGEAGLGQMADSFLTSPEAFNSDFAVLAAYQAALGGPPTLTQFTAAVSSIRAGAQTVGGLFASLIGPNYTAATLYQNLLNRQPLPSEISGASAVGFPVWFQNLIGFPAAGTIAASSNEFQSTGTFHTTLAADHTNALYIRMCYFTILARDPDPSGFTFWLGIANSGGPGILFQGAAGFSTRIQIMGPGTPPQGFTGSPEFQGLFAN